MTVQTALSFRKFHTKRVESDAISFLFFFTRALIHWQVFGQTEEWGFLGRVRWWLSWGDGSDGVLPQLPVLPYVTVFALCATLNGNFIVFSAEWQKRYFFAMNFTINLWQWCTVNVHYKWAFRAPDSYLYLCMLMAVHRWKPSHIMIPCWYNLSRTNQIPYNHLWEKYIYLPKKVEYNKHRSSQKGPYYNSCHSRDAEITCFKKTQLMTYIMCRKYLKSINSR